MKKTFLLTLFASALILVGGCTPKYVGMYQVELPEEQKKQAEALGIDIKWTLNIKKDKTFEMKVMNQTITGTYSVEGDELKLTATKANDKLLSDAEKANQPPPLTIEKDGSLTMQTPTGEPLKFKKQ